MCWITLKVCLAGFSLEVRIKSEAIKKTKKTPTQSEQYQNLIDEPWKTEANVILLTQTYMTTHCLGFAQALRKVLKCWCLLYEEFEDTKGTIRIRKSKDRQHNGQKDKC